MPDQFGFYLIQPAFFPRQQHDLCITLPLCYINGKHQTFTKMKNALRKLSLLFVLIIIVVSCKKDNDTGPSDNLNSNIVSGAWRITYFNDGGNDETQHFAGFSFHFNSNNSVVADNGNISVSGTWITGTDNSSSKLVLSFGNNQPFDDLNEDWHVTMQNSSLIKLKHISGGNGGTDLLYFEKI